MIELPTQAIKALHPAVEDGGREIRLIKENELRAGHP